MNPQVTLTDAEQNPWMISSHEAGHACQVRHSGGKVKLITREPSDDTKPNALGYTDPDPKPESGTDEDVYFLLAGIAGEEIGAQDGSYTPVKYQREWYEAMWSLYLKMAYENKAEWLLPSDDQPDNIPSVLIELHAPATCKRRLEEMYEEMLALLRNDPNHMKIAKLVLEYGTLSEQELDALIESEDTP